MRHGKKTIMECKNSVSRRVAVKSTMFGLLTASLPSVVYARDIVVITENPESK